ncbi:Uncharacterised protein [Vibrio cholerae]|nr:Uncharacterised protein [Vibrio cholerae]
MRPLDISAANFAMFFGASPRIGVFAPHVSASVSL